MSCKYSSFVTERLKGESIPSVMMAIHNDDRNVDQTIKSKDIHLTFRELLRNVAVKCKEDKSSVYISNSNPDLSLGRGRYITGYESYVRNDTMFTCSIRRYINHRIENVIKISPGEEHHFNLTGLVSHITGDDCKRILMIQDEDGYYFHVPISIYADITITEDFVVANLINWCGMSLLMSPNSKFDQNYDYHCKMCEVSKCLFTKLDV